MVIKANGNENQVISVSSAARARAEERAAGRAGGKEQQSGRKTIFAGDLGLQQDMLTQRKMRAQKQALKMVQNAWDGDRKIDGNVAEMKDKLVQLRQEMADNLDVIAEGDAQKEALRQEYDVEMDSQEQKDLELLEKEADYMRGFGVTLTEEEEKRLEELKEQPLTEYQQRCMTIDSYQGEVERRNRTINDQIVGYNGAVRETRLERLKYHEMVDGQKKADKVMAAASKEAIGLLMDEAKEHVDEELEETREEAKEKAEEKAEQEKKIDERKESQEEVEVRIDENRRKNEEQEELRKDAEERSREDADLLEDMVDAGMGGVGSTSDVQSDIKNMLHKMKLLEEDLKGSIVDDEV